jgi:thiol-disulfide isomerase/thioredoxin
MIDIRDGGFSPWAGVVAAVVVALWRGWRRAALRGPLVAGLLAGTLIWIVSPAVLRMGTGPALSDLDEISLMTLQGTPQSLSSLAQGRPVVVNLWATWCPPCRREMPELAAAQQRLPGVTFIFANQGENPVTVQKYLAVSQLVLVNVVLDSSKKLGEQLGSTALPTTLFFNASGRLVDTHLGALSSASLASKLKKMEAPDAKAPGA